MGRFQPHSNTHSTDSIWLFFGWQPSHFFIPYSLWSPYGMDHSIDIPCGFHAISNEFTLQIHVLLHKDSMEQSTVEKHIKCVVKSSANIKNHTLHSTTCDKHKWEDILTTEPYDCYKTANCPHLIVLWPGHAQSKCW